MDTNNVNHESKRTRSKYRCSENWMSSCKWHTWRVNRIFYFNQWNTDDTWPIVRTSNTCLRILTSLMTHSRMITNWNGNVTYPDSTKYIWYHTHAVALQTNIHSFLDSNQSLTLLSLTWRQICLRIRSDLQRLRYNLWETNRFNTYLNGR